MQSIRREQDHVTTAKQDVRQHHVDLFLHPKGLQDDVGVLEALGFLHGHGAGLDQLPGQGLVFGNLRQLARA